MNKKRKLANEGSILQFFKKKKNDDDDNDDRSVIVTETVENVQDSLTSVAATEENLGLETDKSAAIIDVPKSTACDTSINPNDIGLFIGKQVCLNN